MALDEELKEEILAQLCWNDCVANSGIEVEADKARVTLRDKIPSGRMKRQGR